MGRPLKDCIIVDNSPYSYQFQVQNSIPIISWYDDLVSRHVFSSVNHVLAMLYISTPAVVVAAAVYVVFCFCLLFSPSIASKPNSRYSDKTDQQLYELITFCETLMVVDDVVSVLSRMRLKW